MNAVIFMYFARTVLASCGDSGGSSGSSENTKPAPSFATTPNMTIDDNGGGLATEIDLTQYATNVNTDNSVYAFVSTPPSGLTLQENTGKMIWNRNLLNTTAFQIQVKVTNSDGQAAISNEFILTVMDNI